MDPLSREEKVLLGGPVAELGRKAYHKEIVWRGWFRPWYGWNFLCRVAGFRHLCIRLCPAPVSITGNQQAILSVVELFGEIPTPAKSFLEECLWRTKTEISLIHRRPVPPLQGMSLLLSIEKFPFSNGPFTGGLRGQRLHRWTWCGSPSQTNALLWHQPLLFDLEKVTGPNHSNRDIQTASRKRRLRVANLLGQYSQPELQRAPSV